LPFFRAHADKDTKNREPWTFSDELLTDIRETIVLRYKLLPYIYACFMKSCSHEGQPLLRPMWYENPTMDSVDEIEDQVYFGQDLIYKVLTDKPTDTVRFPDNSRWKSDSFTLTNQ